MLKKINLGLSCILFLLLAFCGGIFIGKSKEISIISLIIILLELAFSYLVLKERYKIQWIWLITVLLEILFLITEQFLLFAAANLLLIATALFKVFSVKTVHRKIIITAGRILFCIFAISAVAFLGVDSYTAPVSKDVQLAANIEVPVDNDKLDSAATMLKNIEIMNSFGSRTTGSNGHKHFVSWLEQQLNDMGLTIHRNEYRFDRWEEKRSAIFINNIEVPVSSSFPYSGETDKNGLTGELVYTSIGKYDGLNGKIAVVEIDNTKKLPIGLLMNERRAFPVQNHVVPGDGDLVLDSVLQDPKLIKAKENGVKAVILIWKGVSDAKAMNQYLPFTTDYVGIPAVWVNASNGKEVIGAAQKHEQGTVILEAVKEKNASTESFYVTVEGKNKNESILINSHTDGVNVVEENGALGMLSIIRYLQHEQPQRTMVFAFVTGHFRLPDFKGTSQATSTWMQAHPELWDGNGGNKKAVAGLTVEHLGSMEWKDNADGLYKATGEIQTEYTYANNETMEAIWMKTIEDRKKTRTVLLRGHNKFEFGESQPLFEAGIPLIGLIQMPDYLTVNSKNREMDKFNVHLMRDQVQSLLKATLMIDSMPAGQLGKGERYSFFIGRTN
jgi:hypothetical protein